RWRAGDSTTLATFWISTCLDVTRFEHFLLLLHCHNLILQCSNIIPTLYESPRQTLHIENSRMFPILLASFISNALTPRSPPRRRPPPGRVSKGRAKPINLALQGGVVERLFPFVMGDGLWFTAMSRMLSPYDLNPLNINPLKELIERFVDFEAIRRDRGLELFISATNVQTGELRVFTRAEITAEVVMASAALPLLFRAVEIDGVPYWDGGYSGNPVVTPFLRATATEDALIVQINPRERRNVPTRTREIMSRVNEINFNASLLSELRGVAL